MTGDQLLTDAFDRIQSVVHRAVQSLSAEGLPGGPWDGGGVVVPDIEGLAGGDPARLRRARRLVASRLAASSASSTHSSSAGSLRWALAVGTTSAIALRREGRLRRYYV